MYGTPTFNILCTVHPHSILYERYTHIQNFMYGTPTFNILCTVHPHSVLYVRYTHIKRFTYGTPHSTFYVWYTHIQYFMYGTPTLKQPAATTTTTDIEPTSNGTLADDMPPFRVRFMHSEWVLAKGAVETVCVVQFYYLSFAVEELLPAAACSVCRSVLLSVFSVYQRQTAGQSANAHSELCFPAPSSKLCHNWLRH